MDNIKIVRLKNGEDIVGQLTANGISAYDITEPMYVGLEFQGRELGLVMKHWLPIQLIKKNETVLEKQDILCVIDPADDFCEYYVNTIKKVQDLLKAKRMVQEMTDEEIDEALEHFQDLNHDGNLLH
jgi:hypothetical protein